MTHTDIWLWGFFTFLVDLAHGAAYLYKKLEDSIWSHKYKLTIYWFGLETIQLRLKQSTKRHIISAIVLHQIVNHLQFHRYEYFGCYSFLFLSSNAKIEHIMLEGMVFCKQNCSDLLWEKYFLVHQEKRLKFEAEGWEVAKFLR